ncbi:MAG: FG-GAP-like repeat-containing protein [Candidatus Falkowbacteria bacterium]
MADVNGDGLPDILRSHYYSDTSYKAVYINDGDGTGWTGDGSYTIPEYFLYGSADRGVRLADINGDGLVDILRSQSGTVVDVVYIANDNKSDLLNNIEDKNNSISNIYYKGSAEYYDDSDNLLNPDLPFSLQTAYQIAVDDGLGNIATTTYEYEDGDYYYADEFDRKLAGFGKIKKTNGLSYVTNTYYHQGNDTASTTGEYNDDISKLGKVYRVEIYDDASNLYSKTINKWDNHDLGDDRDFVSLIQSVEFAYDGDEDHKDKATTYTYENTYGNLTGEKFWGEVIGSDDGSFSDTGSDIASSTITYSVSTTPYIVGLPSQDITYDQNNTKVKENKYYYDSLTIGNVDKGNLTKQEIWKSGSNYIDIEKSYNTYGLVTQEKDPRDKATNYTYDEYNLYIATSTNPLSQTTQYYYDYSLGKPKQVIDANSRVFKTTFDGLDRIKKEEQPDLTTPSSLTTKTEYSYDDTSSPRSVQQINYLNSATSTDLYTYLDGLDRVVQTRSEAEDDNTFSVKDFIYNKAGQLEIETLPYFSTGASTTEITENNLLYNIYSYDPLKRVETVVNSIGTTTNAYDQWVLTITDAESNTKDLTKDAFGNLIQVEEDTATSTYTTEYEYDILGNLTNIEDSLDNVRDFTYDGLGRLLTSEDLHNPEDMSYGTTTYAYDDSGNITAKTDPKSQTINYTYDDINRVLTENYTGGAGTEIEYGYDFCDEGEGRLCSATSTNSVINYNFNALGLISSETKTINSVNYQTQYNYDRQGNITLATLPDSAEVKYEYNTAGILEKVSKKESGDASYSYIVSDIDYNPLGQINYQEFANEVESFYTYDPNELYRLINKTTTGPQAGGGEKAGAPQGDPEKESYLSEGLARENLDGSVELYNQEELTDKRTKNSKTYLTGWDKDNKKVYKGKFYTGEIHYFDNKDGEFKDIDTTLQDTLDGWNMNKASYNARIERNLADNFVKFINNNQELYFSLLNYPESD